MHHGGQKKQRGAGQRQRGIGVDRQEEGEGGLNLAQMLRKGNQQVQFGDSHQQWDILTNQTIFAASHREESQAHGDHLQEGG